MNATAVIALANLKRRRRWDTAPRAPFVDVPSARRSLGEAGLPIDGLRREDLPGLERLADAVSELGDCLALRQPPASRAVEVISELASGCTATIELSVNGHDVRSDVRWRDPARVAGLARRVIQELDGVDASRLRQCQRVECDLLFIDATRSRSQRWHAENPCGWLARQQRRRSGDRG
jgi:CGNR zinc finger